MQGQIFTGEKDWHALMITKNLIIPAAFTKSIEMLDEEEEQEKT